MISICLSIFINIHSDIPMRINLLLFVCIFLKNSNYLHEPWISFRVFKCIWVKKRLRKIAPINQKMFSLFQSRNFVLYQSFICTILAVNSNFRIDISNRRKFHIFFISIYLTDILRTNCEEVMFQINAEKFITSASL